MRIIHSADWQIGKVFKQFGAKEETLRQARLSAIERLGVHARENGVRHVLVAGDVYDSEAPCAHTLRAPIERMKTFGDVHWHLLPGNHDPHRPEGVWDRVAQLGVPENIHLHLSPIPATLDENAALLPAPLLRKSEFDDITAWMDAASTPPGALRIGLAHGSVVDFGSGGEASNPIDPTRAAKAHLDYLALGDWHRTLQVGAKTWYAGTPEPDRTGGQEQGTALLVDIAGPGAPPSITRLVTGTYRWVTRSERFDDEEASADLDRRLREEPDLSRLVLRLKLEGSLPLAAYGAFRRRMIDLDAAVFDLDLDEASLAARPTLADLEAIDFDGVLRRSADRLKKIVDDSSAAPDLRRRAEEALVELYLRVAGAVREEAA
ncbi:exonuclease SbcCD subunit D [Bradyrhizobium erythrophlei]|uniref:metallophosphoesterase family protein n=1 Tax=Bradyrhizobium erythrophlei TaxID=1437360 RepID=UPI0035E86820